MEEPLTELAAYLRDSKASAFRAELISFLIQDAVATAITSIVGPSGESVVALPPLPPPTVSTLFGELSRQRQWISERWIQGKNGTVAQVSDERFAQADPGDRLASNDCIYDVPASAPHVRMFLSAVRSDEVCSHLSAAYGEPLQCQSTDVARLWRGQYLRRHSDNHQGRRFGMVFFLSPGWQDDYGGELIVEAPSGESVVMRPRQGHIALIRISAQHQHNVCVIRSPDWTRYSIAAHYAVASTATGQPVRTAQASNDPHR
jgi:hypothetical protein